MLRLIGCLLGIAIIFVGCKKSSQSKPQPIRTISPGMVHNLILQNIDKPDDELIFAIILKNFSDRQIKLEKKIIEFIINRIDRSYGKIYDFIYKIDELSLKKKKPINLKTIKEIL